MFEIIQYGSEETTVTHYSAGDQVIQETDDDRQHDDKYNVKLKQHDDADDNDDVEEVDDNEW